MSKTALILTVRVQPGKRDELRALWDEHLRPPAGQNAAQEFCVVLTRGSPSG
jgi:hypothetical protein